MEISDSEHTLEDVDVVKQNAAKCAFKIVRKCRRDWQSRVRSWNPRDARWEEGRWHEDVQLHRDTGYEMTDGVE